MPAQHRIGIVGFRGYSGAELVRLLANHAHVETILLEHRADAPSRPQPLHQKEPRRLPCSADTVRAEKLAPVFLATPAEVSMELAPAMLQARARVVVLSGAFRPGEAATFSRSHRQT